MIGLCAPALGCHVLLPFEPGGGRAGDGGGDAARDRLAWERAPAIDAARRDGAVVDARRGEGPGPADAQRPLEAKPKADGTKPEGSVVKPDLLKADQGSGLGPVQLLGHTPMTSLWTGTTHDNNAVNNLVVVLVAVRSPAPVPVLYGGAAMTLDCWVPLGMVSTGVFHVYPAPWGSALVEVQGNKLEGAAVATSWTGATKVSCQSDQGSSYKLGLTVTAKPGDVLAAIGAWGGANGLGVPNDLLESVSGSLSVAATQQAAVGWGQLSVAWTTGATADWSVAGAVISP